MRRSTLFCGILTLFIFQSGFSGCALFLLGAGAAGGYAVSKDEVEGHTDAPYDKVQAAARKVIQEQGALIKDLNGVIEGQVQESEVKVQVERVTDKTVRVRIKARKIKGLFPNIKLAQDLYGKVNEKLESKHKRGWFLNLT